MPRDSKINEFIELAKTSGISEQTLVGILTARGWPEKEVYEALAVHYEKLTGAEIPSRGGAGTAAKDAFFYLLIFSTLATWTVGLGLVAFALIERWLADALFSAAYEQFDTYNTAASLASILVAFPIYLLVSRNVLHETRDHPEKLDSPIRKWLTYMALVIAACVFMGDLITAVTYLLRGEITSRFLAKACVVLAISGGVFYYYFGGLRKSGEPVSYGRHNRDTWMAGLSSLIVAAFVVLGFWYIGAPKTQRTLRADSKRVQDLYQLSGQIDGLWRSNGHKLPQNLGELQGVVVSDPVTHTPYEYHAKEGSQYELCADFSLTSDFDEPTPRSTFWSHPSGHHCFPLDAAQIGPSPPYVYSAY